MSKRYLTFAVLLYLTCVSAANETTDDNKWTARNFPLKLGNVSTVVGLLQRLIPDYADQFILQMDSSVGPQDKDTFVLQSSGSNISIKGNSAIALSMGVHYYLKYICKAHVSWSGDQLRIPQPLPKVSTPITITAQDKFRHYQNVCTVSYSMVWWNWTRWEREIDWMALNGINLPLAFTAQEAVWIKVFMGYGFTAKEVNDFLTGPAFLAWNRMGNMQGFGGPLPDSWHPQRVALQKLILQRMRDFGMSPVLPAFAGRIPSAFKRVFPNASVSQNVPWSKFKEPYCCTYFLNPEDPLFVEIGAKYLQTYKEEFGLDHFYSADLFNEMDPPTRNTTFLRNCGEVIFEALTKVDTEAVWVMQGWIFANDPAFWKPAQSKALLTSVPIGRMIVLDLEAEFHPQYGNFESFYGQPFIWCIIHNYGGVEGLYGSLDAINQGPFQGRAYPNSSMIGTGITPEGIERNDVIYDLMNEMAWRTEPVDIDQWIYNYTARRYGKTNELIITGWNFLKKSVYNATGLFKNHGKYIFNTRPSLSKKPYIWYNAVDMISGWESFYQASTDPELSKQETYTYDMLDFTRQAYQLLLDSLYFNLTEAFRNGNLQKTETLGRTMLNLLDDLEETLQASPRFSLDPWIQDATAWTQNYQEELLYEYNARNQISLWGPTGEIIDYANKQWAGVISRYFKPRWDLFISMLRKSLLLGTKFDQNEYNSMVLAFVEEPFTYDTNLVTSQSLRGNPIHMAKHLMEKYKYELSHLNDLRSIRKHRNELRRQRTQLKKMKMSTGFTHVMEDN